MKRCLKIFTNVVSVEVHNDADGDLPVILKRYPRLKELRLYNAFISGLQIRKVKPKLMRMQNLEVFTLKTNVAFKADTLMLFFRVLTDRMRIIKVHQLGATIDPKDFSEVLEKVSNLKNLESFCFVLKINQLLQEISKINSNSFKIDFSTNSNEKLSLFTDIPQKASKDSLFTGFGTTKVPVNKFTIEKKAIDTAIPSQVYKESKISSLSSPAFVPSIEDQKPLKPTNPWQINKVPSLFQSSLPQSSSQLVQTSLFQTKPSTSTEQ